MTKREAFLWESFGSVGPEVIKYYRLAADRQPLPDNGWISYLILSFLFMTLAGGFTLAFKPESEYKALWGGRFIPRDLRNPRANNSHALIRW
jgi:hypothetical protein